MLDKHKKLSVIIGSLLGAAAIQVIVQACDSGDGKARAAPGDCDRWEYMTWYVEGDDPVSAGAWEPFSVTGLGCLEAEGCGSDAANTYAFVGLRRCTP